MEAKQTAWQDLVTIREKSPLVHNITNYVVMNTTANALLSLGASPIMAHAIEEVTELVDISNALVINIGTLSSPWIDSMRKAARRARERGIPVILDPVGAGASRLRTDTAMMLLRESLPTIVRGNASEIRALCSEEAATKGVDSVHASDDAKNAAREIASRHDCVVSISGEEDFIVGGSETVKVSGGHPLMPKVTGMGCTASALTGAFAAVNSDSASAAAHAMAAMAAAGKIAGTTSRGPGSFQVSFLDALHQLAEDDFVSGVELTTILSDSGNESPAG